MHDAKQRQLIRADIASMQVIAKPTIFARAVLLFAKKWTKYSDAGIDAFIKYFNDQWVDSLPGWYEGKYLNV